MSPNENRSSKIDWYPFWLDNPRCWQIRRTIEGGLMPQMLDKERFIWLSNSQNLAHKFLHEDWECPCGKKVAPVWTLEPLNEVTTAMLYVTEPTSGPNSSNAFDSLMDMYKKWLESTQGSGRSIVESTSFLTGPKDHEASANLVRVRSFKKNPNHCEILRGLRELTQMPWLDRQRAMLEVAPLVSKLIDRVSVLSTDLAASWPLHKFFPLDHAVDKMVQNDLAALMAIVNFDAKVTEYKPPTPKDRDQIIVKVTWFSYFIVFNAIGHVDPNTARKISQPTFYVQFSKGYLDLIEWNTYW